MSEIDPQDLEMARHPLLDAIIDNGGVLSMTKERFEASLTSARQEGFRMGVEKAASMIDADYVLTTEREPVPPSALARHIRRSLLPSRTEQEVG